MYVERAVDLFRDLLEPTGFQEVEDTLAGVVGVHVGTGNPAFGSGQEMVVFVTGLNSGFYSLWFLRQYECARYYQYNKRLLFDDQEKEILGKMGI